MFPALQAVFDEHDVPTHATSRDVQDQLSPVLRVAKAAQLQLIEYKGLLADAELADHDHLIDGTMEHIRQTLAAIEREVNALADHGRRVAQHFVQFDRYLTEQRAFLDAPPPTLTVLARKTASTPTTDTVRVAVADAIPQGAASATITYQDQGSGGVTPASGGTVTPAATLTEAAGTFIDYTVTRPAFGAGPGRVIFTITAANRTSVSDAVGSPERASG